MMPPEIVFALFAVISTVGAYLITAHRRGRLAGVGAALLSLIFFVAIYAGLLALLRGASTAH